MGSGCKGLYFGAYTGNPVPGSSDYMKPSDLFSKYIRNRKDIDENGFFDVIAHGTESNITIEHDGMSFNINHRIAAKLLKTNKDYSHEAVRLLACNTGKVSSGFAQNLANKLNKPVKAPSDYLWVRLDGTYFVAGGKMQNGQLVPDYSKPGRFITYRPRRRK